jgi:hypothetical protein
LTVQHIVIPLPEASAHPASLHNGRNPNCDAIVRDVHYYDRVGADQNIVTDPNWSKFFRARRRRVWYEASNFTKPMALIPTACASRHRYRQYPAKLTRGSMVFFINEVAPAECRKINELVARHVLPAFEPEFDVVYQTWLGDHSLRRNGRQQELPS